MSEDADQVPAVAEAVLETSEPTGAAQVGERVAAVLSAAEAAAEQIRIDARREAVEILEQAKHEADAIRAEAAAYENDTHAAVDSYAAKRRQEAEEQVQQQLAEAEAQERATREAAEKQAAQIEEAARRRQLALQEESRSTEEGLQRALQELRRMAVQLEGLVGTPATGSESESLVDALMPTTAVGASAGANDA